MNREEDIKRSLIGGSSREDHMKRPLVGTGASREDHMKRPLVGSGASREDHMKRPLVGSGTSGEDYTKRPMMCSRKGQIKVSDYPNSYYQLPPSSQLRICNN